MSAPGLLLALAVVVAVTAAVRGTWSPCGLSMVSTITPLSERGRGHSYGVTAAWFVLGAVAGGLVLGAGSAVLALVVGVLGLPGPVLVGLGAAATLVCLAADTGAGGVRLPLHPRQVDETWLVQYRRWIYAAGFGAQIGLGLATYVMTAATYLLVVLAVLTGSPTAAVGVGAVFGLVRGSAVLLSARARTPGALRALHLRLAALEPWSRTLAVGVQVAVLGVLGATLAGTVGVVVAAALGAACAWPVLAPQQARRPTP